MEIRRARRNDLDGLLELHRALDAHVSAVNERLWRAPAVGVAYYAERLADEDHRLVVATDGDRLSGYAVGRVGVRPAPPVLVGSIDHAYVVPDCRCRGVGHALIRELMSFFDRRGVLDLTLHVAAGNREGERFWYSLGFEPMLINANATPGTVRRALDAARSSRAPVAEV